MIPQVLGGTTRTIGTRIVPRILNAWDDVLHGTPSNQAGVPLWSSTLAAPVNAGATEITVAGTSGLEEGELIYLDPTSNSWDTTVVTGIDGTTLTVSPALEHAHDIGVECGQAWSDDAHVSPAGGCIGRYLASAITTNPGGPVVVLGDSWALSSGKAWLGFEAAMTAKFPGVELVNAGVSGDDLSEMLARWDADVAAHDPALVVLMSGQVNDVYGSRTTAAILGDLNTMVKHCRTLGAGLLCLGVVPLALHLERTEELKPIVEQFIKNFAAA